MKKSETIPDLTHKLQEVLGDRIRNRREELELNQGELAKYLRIGRTSISNIEAGRQLPPLNVLYEICHALDIDIHSILPTFTEISSAATRQEDEIYKFLQNANLDETVINQIKNVLSNKSHDL